MTVYPLSVTYEKPLEITITGFPSVMLLTPGLIKYQNSSAPIPRLNGVEGTADRDGLPQFYCYHTSGRAQHIRTHRERAGGGGHPLARAPEIIQVPTITPVATSVPLPTAVPPPTQVPVAYASTYDNTDNYTKAALARCTRLSSQSESVRSRPRFAYIEIDNGEICVYPMKDTDGSFPKEEEVTLGAFTARTNSSVTWNKVDTAEGSVAQMILTDDWDITIDISP